MIRILRTIAIVDLAFNGVMFGVGWLFGLSPVQSIGAALIMALTLGLVVGWRAVVRYANRQRQDWTHLTCDPVAPSLTTRATAEIAAPTARRIRVETPAPKLLDAPGRELEVRR